MNNQFVALTNGFRIDTMGSSEGALYFETRYYGLAVGQVNPMNESDYQTESHLLHQVSPSPALKGFLFDSHDGLA